MTPAFRFALQLASAADGAAWCDVGREAEAAGWDVLSMPDHLEGQLAPLVALGALAATTERVRLGTFVLAATWRHVGMLAKEVATLDVLSAGRVEIGLGGGWDAAEFAALGLPFEQPSARIAAVAEVVPLLRRLWRGETVDADGPILTARGLRCDPLPVQQGGPPLVLGGGGRRMLSLAGALADVVSLIPSNAGRTVAWALGPGMDWAAAAEQVRWVQEAAAGRPRPPELNIRLLGVTPGPDPRRAAEHLAAERGAADPGSLVGSPYLLLGRPEDMADQLRRVRDELGVSYFTVSRRHAAPMSSAMDLVRTAP